MRVLHIEPNPFSRVPSLNVARDRSIVKEHVPILMGAVTGLPTQLDGLICLADLQGRERTHAGPGRLLGLPVCEHLLQLAENGRLPSPSRLGVVLAGDLYAVPDLSRRGGCGDVTEVWRAFAEHFRWVVGVLGNHDTLTVEAGQALPANAHLLDGTLARLKELRISGVGGIIGDPAKVNRKDEGTHRRMLESVLLEMPALVVTHEGPSGADPLAIGSRLLRELWENWATLCAAEGRPTPLLVCGHSYWPMPLLEFPHGLQVLKVDGRVVILLREELFAMHSTE